MGSDSPGGADYVLSFDVEEHHRIEAASGLSVRADAKAAYRARMEDATRWLLDRILDKSPTGIRRALYTLKRIEAMPFEEAAAFTESQITLASLTADAKEGIAAFREKRKPVWPRR